MPAIDGAMRAVGFARSPRCGRRSHRLGRVPRVLDTPLVPQL